MDYTVRNPDCITTIEKGKKTILQKDLRFLQSSSYKEYKVNALASEAEEGRDKLRKAAGRSKYLEIRRYPNEGTQHE